MSLRLPSQVGQQENAHCNACGNTTIAVLRRSIHVSQHVTTQTDRVETKAESEYAVRHLTVPRWRLIRVPGCKQQPPLLASEYQCEPQTTAVRRQSMRVKQPQTTAVRRQTMRVKQPQTTIVRRQSMRVKQLQTTAVRERSVRVKPQPSTSVDDRCG